MSGTCLLKASRMVPLCVIFTLAWTTPYCAFMAPCTEPSSGPISLNWLTCAGCVVCHYFQTSASFVFMGCNVRRKWTRSQASAGFRTSEKDGMGVPSRPVMKMR